MRRDEASAALLKAVGFFRLELSANGGYLWRYSEDLELREGEGRGGDTTAWVQPPGTPTVGGALLEAYQLTGDKYYLEAARETAHALAAGQLESGGWDYRIDLAPDKRKKYRYRLDDDRPSAYNTTTLDDNTTQSALRFLMRVDQTLEFKDQRIHNAALYSLRHLLAAQYPNGAWPQRFSGPPDPGKHPVLEATYPEKWSRVHPKEDYRSYYTFNDSTMADMILTMFDATAIYGDLRYHKSAEKAGGFILLAQMPEPQPAWAQQYDARMRPAWARRFEPPAITGHESQGVLRTLMNLYRETGDRRYLEPIPRALDYLQRSRLPGGGLARFYELNTNKPLYFTRQYELTFSDADMPTHYAFKVGSSLDSIRAEYGRLKKSAPAKRRNHQVGRPRMTRALADQARAVIDQLDTRGAWVEKGQLRTFDGAHNTRVIKCRTFVKNVRTLAQFIAASR